MGMWGQVPVLAPAPTCDALRRSLNMAKYTPAPWIVKGDGELLCVTDTNSAYVVDRFRCSIRTQAEHNANARLISAAPDLLFACEVSLEILLDRIDLADISDDEKRHVDTLRRVIAKAEEPHP